MKTIDEQTNYIFNCIYDDLPDEKYYANKRIVDNQITAYGWEATFESWKKYLFNECKTPESVINFANLFWG